jgi:hypothetical protein
MFQHKVSTAARARVLENARALAVLSLALYALARPYLSRVYCPCLHITCHHLRRRTILISVQRAVPVLFK